MIFKNILPMRARAGVPAVIEAGAIMATWSVF